MTTPPDSAGGSLPKLLIVESDPATARMMADALQRTCCPAESIQSGRRVPGEAVCFVVESLQQLHTFDLSCADMVICSVNLPDGSGLDALAYLRGTRPTLPVVLAGSPGDAALAVEAIRAGAMDFLLTTAHDMRTLPLAVEKCIAHQRIKQENERLQRDLSRSLAELEVKNQQLEAMIRQLEAMARTDELTSLANRRWLNLMLEGSWAEATRNNLPLACLMIDLDGFKALNDTLGHQRGDDMLQLASRVIEANSREVDVAARYGGDEFCVLMPHTEPYEAVLVAGRILREFERAIRGRDECERRLGMSIGLAHVDLSRPINAEQLILHADEALYAAKGAGKNRVMLRDTDGVYAPMTAA
ncbi:MAG: diguanylate cyclase [Planctomycetota bacterium]|nr:diguanylate cyclase [Planctomycetota bacterium]